MWLDMYVNKKYYFSEYFKSKVAEDVLWDKVLNKLVKEWFNALVKRSMDWRKANWIHWFFVDKLQDGYDDCWEYYFDLTVLEDLKKRIEMVLKAYKKWTKEWIDVAKDQLPTKEGFFFWGTEYVENYDEDGKDPYYITTLKETKEWIDKELKEDDWGEYYYTSSW